MFAEKGYNDGKNPPPLRPAGHFGQLIIEDDDDMQHRRGNHRGPQADTSPDDRPTVINHNWDDTENLKKKAPKTTNYNDKLPKQPLEPPVFPMEAHVGVATNQENPPDLDVYEGVALIDDDDDDDDKPDDDSETAPLPEDLPLNINLGGGENGGGSSEAPENTYPDTDSDLDDDPVDRMVAELPLAVPVAENGELEDGSRPTHDGLVVAESQETEKWFRVAAGVGFCLVVCAIIGITVGIVVGGGGGDDAPVVAPTAAPQQRLTPLADDQTATGTNDDLGTAVAVSGDGTVFAAGASGAAYVRTWNAQVGLLAEDIVDTDPNSGFGRSVVLSEDGTVLGVAADSFVRLYSFDSAAWTQMGSDIPVESPPGLALTRSGLRVAIGSPGTQGFGHCDVYEFDNGDWQPLGLQLVLGQDDGDLFGSSASFSADGDLLAVGAPSAVSSNGILSGQVHVFRWSGLSWESFGSPAEGDGASDGFGAAVAMRADGTCMAVGAPEQFLHDATANRPGYARLHCYSENGGTSGQWLQESSINVGNAGLDGFGASVTLSADGSILVVGAPGHDGTGAVEGTDAGQIQVFVLSGGAWVRDVSVVGVDGSQFGYGVSLSNDGSRLAVGAPAINATQDGGYMRAYQLNIS